MATVGSYGGGVSYERGTPVERPQDEVTLSTPAKEGTTNQEKRPTGVPRSQEAPPP